MTTRTAPLLLALAVTLTACGDDDRPTAAPAATTASTTPTAPTEPTSSVDVVPATAASDDFPDIVGVEAVFDDGTETWTFAVTVSSPYDTPERYADGWRVVGPDGTVFGVHTLTHDHASEQPFTRRQTGVEIPADVTEVTIEGRDQVSGFGGGTAIVPLQGGDA